MRILLLLLLPLFYTSNAFTQDTCQLRMSLLTCAPGEELYSTFGHTALRVQNESSGTDEVFNYGTFEFGPDFYMQFIRGKLLYFLSVENFQNFVQLYQYEQRPIREQVLQLNCLEKQKLYSALRINSLDQNKFYKYDFLYDNCTTRAGAIVYNNAASTILFKNIIHPPFPSFRNLIHNYLDTGHHDWSKLGIDLLLGAKLDKQVTNKEAMFLPDYLLKGFDSATINLVPLVSPANTILSVQPLKKSPPVFTPVVVFSLLLLIIATLTFTRKKWSAGALKVFDFLFFFTLGLIGMLLIFMWLGTDHKLCQNNYNLIWALPTNFVMAFFVHSNKLWVKHYFRIVFGISALLLVAWFWLPQQMNNALLPIVLLIIFRAWDLSKKNKYASRNNHN